MKANLLSIVPKFFLDNDPIDMSVTDTSDYANNAEVTTEYTSFAIANSQVEGVVDARLPNGNIFYDGDETFVSPDIDRDITDAVTGIPITLDANNAMIEGQYVIDYTVRITNERLDFPIISIGDTGGKNQIIIAGNYVTEFTGQTNIDITGTSANNGTALSFDTVSYDAVFNRTTVQLNTSNAAETPSSGLIKLTATLDYTTQGTYGYAYEDVDVEIEVTYDADKSELRSEDKTDYSQYDGATPSSRNHIVRYPVDLVPAVADIDQPQAIISVNPIYTNIWTSTVRSTVIITQTDGLIIQDELTGTESINVEANAQWCEIFSVLEAVASNYDQSVDNGRQSEIDRWNITWDKIKGYEMLWRIARQCGDATSQQKYYDLTIETAGAEGVTIVTDTAPSAPSVAVQPITSGGLTTNYNELVNQWLTGVGAPLDQNGNEGDFYLRQDGVTTKGDVYQKSGGTWGSPIMNIDGVDGNPGAAGANGTNGTDGTSILFSDATRRQTIGATAGLQGMTGRTMSVTAGLLADGDALEVFADLTRSEFQLDGINISVGSYDFNYGLPGTGAIPPPHDIFVLKIRLMREDATTLKAQFDMQSYESFGTASGLQPVQYSPQAPAAFSSPGEITVLDMDSNALTIALETASSGSATQTFTSEQMSVTLIKR